MKLHVSTFIGHLQVPTIFKKSIKTVRGRVDEEISMHQYPDHSIYSRSFICTFSVFINQHTAR